MRARPPPSVTSLTCRTLDPDSNRPAVGLAPSPMTALMNPAKPPTMDMGPDMLRSPSYGSRMGPVKEAAVGYHLSMLPNIAVICNQPSGMFALIQQGVQQQQQQAVSPAKAARKPSMRSFCDRYRASTMVWGRRVKRRSASLSESHPSRWTGSRAIRAPRKRDTKPTICVAHPSSRWHSCRTVLNPQHAAHIYETLQKRVKARAPHLPCSREPIEAQARNDCTCPHPVGGHISAQLHN
jgi:hypothetical protein